MSHLQAWRQARRILCIRLDNMGDVLMTTPAIRALKQASAGRSLTLLTSTPGSGLAPFLPDVDDTIAYDAPWVKNAGGNPAADLAIIEILRQRHFDAAVIFTVFSQNPLPAALLCRLAGIPLTLAHCRENPYGLLSDWVREKEPAEFTRHEAQRQLDLVEHAGAFCLNPKMVFQTTRADHQNLRTKLELAGVDPDGSWVVVHCGATAPSRRYPPELFAQALQKLGPRGGTVILSGGESERALTREVETQCGAAAPLVDMAGQLTLGEFACLIRQARLLLSNNTGPVHLACALGTPVVDLYALTNPQHTPWMVPHRLLFHDVPCKFCYRSTCPQGHHDCLRRVSPDAVCGAVLDLLQETRPAPLAKAI